MGVDEAFVAEFTILDWIIDKIRGFNLPIIDIALIARRQIREHMAHTLRVYKVVYARIPDNGKMISSFHWTDPAKEKDNKQRLRDLYTEFAVGGVVNFHNQDLVPLLKNFVSPMP